MRIFILLSTLFLISCDQTENNILDETVNISNPKNIILLIGDGMGEAEITLTRAYEFDGEAGLYVDEMKNRGSVIVKQLMVDDPTKYEFVGESASGATTISTGHRTSDGRIAVSAFDGSPIKTIMEEAIDKGYKTGLVTTAIVTDATPAAFAAHAQNRYCFKLGDKACDTHGDTPIVEQMIGNNIDVLLGGGHELLDATNAAGKPIPDLARENGYSVVSDRDALLALPPKTKTFGVFSTYHMPVEWQGPDGRGATQIALGDDGNMVFPTPAHCEINPAHAGMPTLEEMAGFALDSLSGDKDAGFFLMIEGASIDKQAHVAKPCGTIGEMLAFDRTVKMAVEYAEKLGNTAVIVTADHGQATQMIYRPSFKDGIRNRDHMPGLYDLLLSKGGHEIGAYYGTNNADDQAHTGINVPIYTVGLDKPESLTGVIQQDDIYGVMKEYLFN